MDIEHIYCLAHVRAKFIIAYNIGKVKEAKYFIDCIQELYRLESLYKKLKLVPDEIKKRRNNKETSDIIQKMREELDRLWPKDKEKQSELDPIFATALRYLYNQWGGLMNYRNDGEYSIDNNTAGVSRGHYNIIVKAKAIMEILSANIKEMRVGPSQSVYRNRLQTITSCAFEQSRSGERCV